MQEHSTILCHPVPFSEARKKKRTEIDRTEAKESTNGGGEIMDRVRIGDEAEEKTTLANSRITNQKNLEGVIVAATANS